MTKTAQSRDTSPQTKSTNGKDEGKSALTSTVNQDRLRRDPRTTSGEAKPPSHPSPTAGDLLSDDPAGRQDWPRDQETLCRKVLRVLEMK